MRQLCRIGIHARPRVIVREGALQFASCPACHAELARTGGRWKAAARLLTHAPLSVTQLVRGSHLVR